MSTFETPIDDQGSCREIERFSSKRRRAATCERLIMHGVTNGAGRDRLMGRHEASHIRIACADAAEGARKAMPAKAALAEKLGVSVHLCGDIG